jgi:hypothetical protein
MFFWNKPLGHKIFGLKPEFADKTRVLTANLGLYNGFLAAGLIRGLITQQFAWYLQLFFLVLRGNRGRFWWNYSQSNHIMGSGITRYDYTYSGFFGTIHLLNTPREQQEKP